MHLSSFAPRAIRTVLPALLAFAAAPGVAFAKDKAEEGVAREIVRGPFAQTNIGTTIYIGARGPILRPGTTVDLSVGGDVVDKPGMSASVQFTVTQAVHVANVNYETQGSLGFGPQQLIQGNTYTIGGLLVGEVSGYPVRRLGIGGRVGAGVMAAPWLMDRESRDTFVIDEAWGLQNSTAHRGVLPTIVAGPTLEYYTKLSHFSMGVDADFIYAIGLDFGVKASGYFKYTF